MEDSYRQSPIHEPGNCQEGKYEEEEKEKRKSRGATRIFIAEETVQTSVREPGVCRDHMTRLNSGTCNLHISCINGIWELEFGDVVVFPGYL
jgi:hypothetical protein